MEAKVFEVRDSATFLPVLAVRCTADSEAQRYLFSRLGYGCSAKEQTRFVLLSRLSADGPIHYDPYSWGDRTLSTAHQYIVDNFERLENGAVVDVEYILGERKQPKISERLELRGGI